MLQTNALSVAYKAIRNGVFFLFALTLLFAGRMLIGSASKAPHRSQGGSRPALGRRLKMIR